MLLASLPARPAARRAGCLPPSPSVRVCLPLILHACRRRGPPAPSVAAAMATRVSVEDAAHAGSRGASLSVREALDAWFYAYVEREGQRESGSGGPGGHEAVSEVATERDFLLSWVDAQIPGISADE